MSKVTSKLQVTIPKVVADQLHLRPGDEVEWIVTGSTVQLFPVHAAERSGDAKVRREIFDAATARRDRYFAGLERPCVPPADRGWTRAELYGRRGEPR